MTDEENKQQQSGTGEVVDNTDYIDTIKKLKENSVDKAKYEALRLENKKLLDAVVNGTEVAQTTVEDRPSLDELRKRVFENPDQTNLEYVTNALALRERLMEEGYEDPFVPSSSQYSPTAVDYDTAYHVAEALQEMVDIADGDPNVFRNEFQRRVKDVQIPNRKK